MLVSDSDSKNATNGPIEDNRFALVVGINSSSQSSYQAPLQYAERDAYDIAQVLRTPTCGFTLLEPLLIGREAHTMAVRTAVGNLIRKRTEQDFLIFYFSGHAKAMRTSRGQSDIYFVTHDFNENQVDIDPSMHLSMRWLREVLYQPIEAGKVLLILDCCYADTESNNSAGRVDVYKLIQDYFEQASKEQNNHLRVIITAGGYNRAAYEKNGHGFMTLHLLQALRGEAEEALDNNGRVNIYTLCNYLQTKMPVDGQ